jgi:hypothetical protein
LKHGGCSGASAGALRPRGLCRGLSPTGLPAPGGERHPRRRWSSCRSGTRLPARRCGRSGRPGRPTRPRPPPRSLRGPVPPAGPAATTEASLGLCAALCAPALQHDVKDHRGGEHGYPWKQQLALFGVALKGGVFADLLLQRLSRCHGEWRQRQVEHRSSRQQPADPGTKRRPIRQPRWRRSLPAGPGPPPHGPGEGALEARTCS